MRELYYNEKKCDGCAEIMHDSEDIVVCPECGTPQHRECYNKNNACVNAHLHAEDFDWRKANIIPEEPKPVEESAGSAPMLDTESGIPDIPLPIFNAESIVIDNKTVSTNTEFNGIRIKDAVTYIQVNANRYIKKFIKNENRKNFLSWNWGAFFFSPAWFFYRKLYKAGAVFLTLAVAAALVVTPYLSIIDESYAVIEPMLEELRIATEAFSENQNETTQAAVQAVADALFAETKKVMPYVLAVDVATFLLPCTAAAIMANNLYRKKMLEDISIARKASDDLKLQQYSLLRRGGVSLFAGFAAFMAENYLPSIIMSVIKNFI